MTRIHCHYNNKRRKKFQYLQTSFLFSSWPTFYCLSKSIFPLPQPLYFSFTWAENRFLQNEIVLDFSTNIAMVSIFKYLQWKHIHMHRPTDRHRDVHMCAHAHMHTHTDRHAEQTEIHTDTDIYPQTYSGPDARMLSVIQCGVLFPRPLYKQRSDRTTAITILTVFLVYRCHMLKGIFKSMGKCDGM